MQSKIRFLIKVNKVGIAKSIKVCEYRKRISDHNNMEDIHTRGRKMGLRERRRKERAEQRKKNVLNIVITVICAVFVLGGIGYLCYYYWNIWQNEAHFEALRPTETPEVTEEVFDEPETETEASVIYCEKVYDFDVLKEQNEDIYAWIVVPGTQVDYPVLQSDTDNYYLDYNMDGTKGYPGCIYTNDCNAKDFSDYNTVFYGHNMKNGSMFGSLHQFEEDTFFEENSWIYIYTEDRRLTYEIFASVKFSDVYIPAYYDVASEAGNESFLKELTTCAESSEESHIREEVTVTPEDTFVTLSTCVSGERKRRYLVVGKLVEEAFYRE